MRELHVVAVSEDGRHVLLGATKNASKGTYRVRLDARLISAVRGDLGVTHDRDLSPKEIQARLRAGETAEQIARSAGMPITRVERFAGPVAGERLRMIEGAREAFVVRGRLGRSAQPMGRAVDTALGAANDAATWTARREDDGRWCVQVSWSARGRSRTASWRYEPHDRSLEAADPGSAALGHVEAEGELRRTPKKVAPVVSAPATPAPAAKKAAPAKKAAAAKKASPSTKTAATKPTAKKAAKKAAAPGKKAAGKVAAPPKKAAAKKAAATKSASKAVKRAPAKRPAPAAPKRGGRPRLQVVPDPPRRTRAKAAAAPAPKAKAADERDGVRSRASVPAWADVLLGTTPNDQ